MNSESGLSDGTSLPDDVANTNPATQNSRVDLILSLFGFRKLSDEEYLAQLRAERDAHLARIRELEEQERERKEGSRT